MYGGNWDITPRVINQEEKSKLPSRINKNQFKYKEYFLLLG
jgi:hypothetical protein